MHLPIPISISILISISTIDICLCIYIYSCHPFWRSQPHSTKRYTSGTCLRQVTVLLSAIVAGVEHPDACESEGLLGPTLWASGVLFKERPFLGGYRTIRGLIAVESV